MSQTQGQFNFGIDGQFRNWNLKENGIGIDNLKFPTNKLNPQIKLSFNFLIQKYFFQDNLTWNINCLEQIFQVGCRTIFYKIGIGKLELINLTWN